MSQYVTNDAAVAVARGRAIGRTQSEEKENETEEPGTPTRILLTLVKPFVKRQASTGSTTAGAGAAAFATFEEQKSFTHSLVHTGQR